jgi:4-hydroxymandelate oxidase
MTAQPAAPDVAGFGTLAGFEAAARERLPSAVLDYVAGGSWDGVTLADNGAAFRRYRFRPSVLSGLTVADLSTTVLGREVGAPLGIAPMAQYGWCHPEAELPAARAAATAGCIFTLSTLSTCPIEDVAAAGAVAGPGPRWFQLYIQPDLGLSRTLVERAVSAGYAAIVVTVDVPVLGYRGTDLRAVGLREVRGNLPAAPAAPAGATGAAGASGAAGAAGRPGGGRPSLT